MEKSFNGLEKKISPLYMDSCERGGINLNLYHLGHYTECYECDKQKSCQKSSLTAGEQAEP